MERLIKRIKRKPELLASIKDCENQISPILQKNLIYFPEYTDHSIFHSKRILGYVACLLSKRINKLNEDEVYVLIMAGYLHDIGMCPTKKMIKEIKESCLIKKDRKSISEYLRKFHHKLSYEYILTHWKKLKIINERYAEAIALVAFGHRIEDLCNLEIFNPDFSVRSGSDYVCLPYLAGILRLADELDITNDRTPDLLYNQYFPENKISKEEWEKHKANYLVNFKDDTIKITSYCEKKELYYALLKQYKKIENEINNFQKLIRIIPQLNKKLNLSFFKLEKDIKTDGFIPKEIGFSFDLQNTIDIFIGNNIYINKYAAIRECLQNAIDTCLYRKKLSNSNYKPIIGIVLNKKKLIISDNGLGMDEFIIEKYFAKLAKSFYLENKVLNEFEAISQFGIGVFSYFLICDYFDVESKAEGKDAIKFRVNKDADNYFHFYDQVNRNAVGTSITFFLREEISIEELINQVKHYIRYVEIPISINYKKRNEKIVSQDFILEKEKDLKNKIVSLKIKTLNNLEIISSKISTDEYDGVLGLIISKDKRGRFNPHSISNLFKKYLWDSQIELSHKGIYVNDIKDIVFKWIIGKINLKKKKTIDVGRYNIKNNENINSIVSDFHFEILQKLFKNWELEPKKVKVKLSRNFLDNYILYHSVTNINDDVLNLLKENIYFTIYIESRKRILSLKELDSLEEIVILNSNSPFSCGRDYDFEDVRDIYNFIRKPLLLENNEQVAETIISLFRFMRKQIEVTLGINHWHFVIKKNKIQKTPSPLERIYPISLLCFHDKPHIASYPKISVSIPFNPKHKVLDYYLSNIKSITGNQSLNDLFVEFFNLAHNFIFNFHVGGIKYPTYRIENMNEVLSSINIILSTDFVLSKNDFPTWINREIKWKNCN